MILCSRIMHFILGILDLKYYNVPQHTLLSTWSGKAVEISSYHFHICWVLCVKRRQIFIQEVPDSCREKLLEIVRDVLIRDVMYGFIAGQR